MSEYNIDFDVVSAEHIPVEDRLPKRRAWLRALLGGLKQLYNEFMLYRALRLYELGHNSQVCYMEAALNDVFDPISRGIVISDSSYHDPVYFYREDEEKPVYMDLESEIGMGVIPDPDPLVFYLESETYDEGVVFYVQVPFAVSTGPVYDVNRLRAVVDKYRLPSKGNYVVQII